MRPYNKPEQQAKGISGTRRSCSTAHRKRCLRVDKRAARQEAKRAISLTEEQFTHTE